MKRVTFLLFLMLPLQLNAQTIWHSLSASFLEPNRFATIYDHEASRLILEAGYGATILHTESVDFGAEALIWSGLKTLTGFRFPVETADYFFGINAIIPSLNTTPFLTARIRLAHISSHRVDGTKDSVIGGSSSKFSREFISVETQYHSVFGDFPFRAILGVKYIFHQVTHVEPIVQVIAAVEYPFMQWSSSSDHSTFFGGEIFASASTGTGPQDQNARFAVTLRTLTDVRHTIDIFAAFHLGATIYGIEGDRTRNGFEIGVMFSTVSF